MLTANGHPLRMSTAAHPRMPVPSGRHFLHAIQRPGQEYTQQRPR